MGEAVRRVTSNGAGAAPLVAGNGPRRERQPSDRETRVTQGSKLPRRLSWRSTPVLEQGKRKLGFGYCKVSSAITKKHPV